MKVSTTADDDEEEVQFIQQQHDEPQQRVELNISKCHFYCFLVVVGIIGAIAVTGLVLVFFYHKEDSQFSEIVFLHFSDFYQIEGIPSSSSDKNLGKGGLARLATIIKSQKKPTIVTFGGDLFSPSSMSTFLGGPYQMVEGFNKLQTLAQVVAVAGNHEFDDVKNSTENFERFNFPWLLANFYEPNTTTPFLGTQPTFIIDFGGIKIGFIGLSFDYRTVTLLTPTDASYEDYIAVAHRRVSELKSSGVEFIVALTHLPIPDEQLLLKSVIGIDICLAGHDHIFYYERINEVPLVEGDVDLSSLSVVTLSFIKGTDPLVKQISVENIAVDTTIPKDPDMQAIIDKWTSIFSEERSIFVGKTSVDLHAYNSFMRRRESNIGNFVVDSIREWATDLLEIKKVTNFPVIGFINSGGLRWTTDISAGSNITKGNLLDLLPFGDVTSIIEIDSDILKSVLENSVSVLPFPSGRFLQISGFRFVHACDVNLPTCNAPIGSRILNITLNNGTLLYPSSSPSRLYAVTGAFVAGGGDGYSMLPALPVVVDSQSGDSLFDLTLYKIEKLHVIHPTEEGRITAVT